MRRVIGLLIFCLPLYFVAAQEGADEAEVAEIEGESLDSYSNVPKKDDLRLTGSLGFSKLHLGGTDYNQVMWKGTFDYYLHDMLSMQGVAYVPFGKADKGVTDLSNYYLGMGGNLHAFQWSDFDFFGGATAGFSIVSANGLATKGVPTIEFGGGIGIFGSFFHLVGEVNYRIASYYSRGTFIEMNQLIFSGGIGFKI